MTRPSTTPSSRDHARVIAQRLKAGSSRAFWLRVAVVLGLLGLWARFFVPNYEGFKRAFDVMCAVCDINGASHGFFIGIFAFIVGAAQYGFMPFIHRELGKGKNSRLSYLRPALNGAFYSAVFVGLAPGTWLTALGRPAGTVLLIAATVFVCFLYYELLYGLALVAGVVLLSSLAVSFLAIPLVLVSVLSRWDLGLLPYVLLLSAPAVLIGSLSSLMLVMFTYLTMFAVILYAVPVAPARSAIFDLYRYFLFLTFPVYAAVIYFMDKKLLRQFVIWNAPLVTGEVQDTAAEEGGAFGGGGAAGGF